MLLCDDVHPDATNPACTHIDCLMSNIVSLEDPPFPFQREQICVYVALTAGHGRGTAQVKIAYVDSEPEQLQFGSAEHELAFSQHSPLEVVSVVFRIRDCVFTRPGLYSVQFWYNGKILDERLLRLKEPPF